MELWLHGTEHDMWRSRCNSSCSASKSFRDQRQTPRDAPACPCSGLRMYVYTARSRGPSLGTADEMLRMCGAPGGHCRTRHHLPVSVALHVLEGRLVLVLPVLDLLAQAVGHIGRSQLFVCVRVLVCVVCGRGMQAAWNRQRRAHARGANSRTDRAEWAQCAQGQGKGAVGCGDVPSAREQLSLHGKAAVPSVRPRRCRQWCAPTSAALPWPPRGRQGRHQGARDSLR